MLTLKLAPFIIQLLVMIIYYQIIIYIFKGLHF